MITAITPETEASAESQSGGTMPAPSAGRTWEERTQLWQWWILGALIVIMLAQLWTSVVQLSITSDEVDHLHAAFRYWQCNDFGWNPEHPPLVKIIAGVPLQFMHVTDPLPHACGATNVKVVDFLAGHQFVFANPERMLTAARFSVSIFSVLLLLTAWFAARKMFGFPVAIIASVLVAFEPNILAHGALITTDVAATLAILLAVYALYLYVTQPRWDRVLALGLAVGFALCAKHSTVLLAIILPSLLILDALFWHRNERGKAMLRYAGVLILTGAIALTVLWACYGFRYAARPAGAQIWTPPRLVLFHGLVPARIIPTLERWHVMPQAYLVGLQDVVGESEVGRPSFLLGKVYHNANWFYFPVAMAIKFTLPVLLLIVISATSLQFWTGKRRELMFLLVPALLFLGISMHSGLNIGIRHLLPILPFLVIFAAAGSWSIACRYRWTMVTLLALLIFHVASSLHAYPNYISYSNEVWGGPGETYRYLSHADVDWGQAQKMVRAYVEKTHPSNCFFLRAYSNLNSDYGIPCRGISEIQWDQLETPFTGTLIAGSGVVNGMGVKGITAEIRRTLKDIKPTAKLGGSAVLVYEGTFDVSPIVAKQLVYKARNEGDLDPQFALQDAEKAAGMDPLNGDAHVVICGAYRALGEIAKAQQECDTGLALVRKDPQYGPEQVKYLKDFILRNGLQVRDSN
jgi:4-amino-4-deoxy-L-arabinose transferase-like glycosyltransferase